MDSGSGARASSNWHERTFPRCLCLANRMIRWIGRARPDPYGVRVEVGPATSERTAMEQSVPGPDEPSMPRRRKWYSRRIRIVSTVAVVAGYSVVMVDLGFATQVALAVTMVVCDLAASRITDVIGGSDRS
jgi:hypothetical protein